MSVFFCLPCIALPCDNMLLDHVYGVQVSREVANWLAQGGGGSFEPPEGGGGGP